MVERPTVTTKASTLQALLNALHDANRTLTIRYPLFDINLFDYDPTKGETTNWVDLDTFEEARSTRLPSSTKLAHELPEWDDLGDALLSSGAWHYDNLSQVQTRMQKAREMAQDANNPEPIYFGFDTNVLYHRLASRWLPERILPGGLEGLRFVISQAVREELDTAIRRKYTDTDIRNIRAHVVNSQTAKPLRGRPYKQGRKAKAALTDVITLRKENSAAQADAADLVDDKEENDRIIAKSYANFAQDRGSDVILFTSDRDMESHARAVGIRSQYLDHPTMQTPEPGPMDETTLARLIHDLAVTFGVLQLHGLDSHIWGVWPGKSLGHWDDQALHFDCNAVSEPMTRFRDDLEALRILEDGF